MSGKPETFEEFMANLEKEPRSPFVPGAFHSHHGDMIEVYWKNDSFYVEQLMDNGRNRPLAIALYRSQETGETVGCHVCGVKRLVADLLAEEREACAKLAESMPRPIWDENNVRASQIAAAIRSRGP